MTKSWQKSELQVFWGEVAPCDHVVQIYENDKTFLDSLEGFIGSGLLAEDSVIIIATAEHIRNMHTRLKSQGFDIDFLIAQDQYIALDASETLSKFMVNNWPDEKLFFQLITAILKRAQQGNRKVRAFGEMVAILWQQGLNGATVQLENLWNELHKKDQFSLFCAYPKVGFTQDMHSSMETICCAHTKMIDGSPKPSTEIYYKIAN
ncbi:MAG TPA: MEDS domain-containing protein [Ferruginibacter sp.]|nr:MEDS domain-containing protein [Ferruginibacter sp.]